MKKLISASTIRGCKKGDTIYVDKNIAILTPEAFDLAKRSNVNIVFGQQPDPGLLSKEKDNSEIVDEVTKRVAAQFKDLNLDEATLKKIVAEIIKKECGSTNDAAYEYVKDSSGFKVVKGNTIKLGRFEDAGKDKNIGLTDIITHHDGSTMAAGMMSWKKEDSFPWKLTYEEIDYVIEGELAITINGKTYNGQPGDVFYIPKGSDIVFGTPSSVKIMYVTYPANWAEQN